MRYCQSLDRHLGSPAMMAPAREQRLIGGAECEAVNHDLVARHEELYGDCVNRLLLWGGIAPAGRMTKRLDG